MRVDETSQVPAGRRQNRSFTLGSLSIGHGVSHLYDQGFPIFMPTITSWMSLSSFQVAALLGIRQVGFGLVNLGGGPLVDMLKRHWGLIMTACMVWTALAFAFIGASPNFGVLFIAVMLVAIPGSVWHLPAAAALSQRFPDRKGFAISIHGLGSNIGNVLGPVLAGGLLATLFWRNVLFIYAVPALVVAVLVWWSLKDMGREGRPEERIGLGTRFQEYLAMLKHPIVPGLILAATLRGIGLNAMFHWTPFYLEDELGMGHLEAGVHYALLSGMGIVSAPVLGTLSDKFGRKTVLVPGMVIATILSLLVVSTGDSFLLAAVLASMGLFSFAMHYIMHASLLDVVGRGREATATGLIFGLSGVIGGATPFLASLIIDHLGGYGAIYYYVGILTALATVVVIIMPLQTKSTSPDAAA